MDDVMFSHGGLYGAWHWQYRRQRRAKVSSENFQHIRQKVPHCLTLLSCTVTANCKPRAKFDVSTCLVDLEMRMGLIIFTLLCTRLLVTSMCSTVHTLWHCSLPVLHSTEAKLMC